MGLVRTGQGVGGINRTRLGMGEMIRDWGLYKLVWTGQGEERITDKKEN
jgi:hypothetical protein